MSEKTWSSIASADSEQERVRNLAIALAGMDAGVVDPLPSTPDEFLHISKDAQSELEGPMTKMIEGITNVLADADARLQPNRSAPRDFEYVFIDEGGAREMDNSSYPNFWLSDPMPNQSTKLKERYRTRGSSSTFFAMDKWDEEFDQELVRKGVVVFDVMDIVSNETSAHNVMALPVIMESEQHTMTMVHAVRDALQRFIDLSQDDQVTQFLKENDFSDLNFARNMDGTFWTKTAPIRMYSEAIATTAELTAMAIADMDPDIDVGRAICELAKKNFFAKTALAIPMGVVGPLSNGGLVPKGGLVEKSPTGELQIKDTFSSAIERTAKNNKQYVTAAMGLYGLLRKLHPSIFLDQHSSKEANDFHRGGNRYHTIHEHGLEGNLSESLARLYSAVSYDVRTYGTEHSYFAGEGCPAVFYAPEAGVSPISLVAKWVLKSYMPKK